MAGLSVAYFLRARGADVTVLESNRVGSAASSGNAGWLCPAQAGPLPEPGLTGYGLRSLVDRESALYFAPLEIPRMLTWLARFAARCNARDYRDGVIALTRLGQRTFELAERFAADGVDFELHRRGLLAVSEDHAHAADFLAKLQPMRELGVTLPDRVLGAGELRELEPALGGRAAAAVHIEEHWHVHAPNFMRGLGAHVRGMGVRVEEGAEVVELVSGDRGVREIRTAAGDHAADQVVLAAGAWSPRLARQLGFRLPVAPGKGYSFEVQLDRLPQHALLLLDPHVGASPLGDRLRVAGTMEFSGVNARLDPARGARRPAAQRPAHRHAADRARRPADHRPRARPRERLRRHRVLDAGHDPRGAGRGGAGRAHPHRRPAARARAVPGHALRIEVLEALRAWPIAQATGSTLDDLPTRPRSGAPTLSAPSSQARSSTR